MAGDPENAEEDDWPGCSMNDGEEEPPRDLARPVYDVDQFWRRAKEVESHQASQREMGWRS